MNNKPLPVLAAILILLFTGCRTTGVEREGDEREPEDDPAGGKADRWSGPDTKC